MASIIISNWYFSKIIQNVPLRMVFANSVSINHESLKYGLSTRMILSNYFINIAIVTYVATLIF